MIKKMVRTKNDTADFDSGIIDELKRRALLAKDTPEKIKSIAAKKNKEMTAADRLALVTHFRCS